MLALTVLVKCLAHWTVSVLPLVLASPLLGLFMNMEPAGIGATALTLLVGTPAITLIGAVGAAVAVSLPRGGLLVSVIVLPLTIPVLIFGVSASYGAVEEPAPFLAPFLILAAITCFLRSSGRRRQLRRCAMPRTRPTIIQGSIAGRPHQLYLREHDEPRPANDRSSTWPTRRGF